MTEKQLQEVGRTYEIFMTDDGSHSVRVGNTDVTFHSTKGALRESRHVFLDNGFLYWLQQQPSSKKLTVFEVGFGTGLNALLTAIAATQNRIDVHYHAVDLYPLPVEIYSRLNYPELLGEPELYKIIMQTGWEQLLYVSPFFRLHKSKSDLLDYTFKVKVDVVYFDAFAPEDQPEMWVQHVYTKIYEALNPGGVLVTYCSKGVVRRALHQAGFTVVKLPGPPGKREVIRAIKE
ncbi:tRNA (5-methylaminomethyl-2-thiouridine)(34)-methyltransferase MnmD [Niabella digestorum]|jgi:Uncharacterized conserved protein|uniref:tRNA (5-methylaminomethyl-2-thiouridine)(34)-methyltransferase MnmD n=1 Tax=Niabella digestorum TaxID=3117701 RepID=A0ABU7REK7_9BACT